MPKLKSKSTSECADIYLKALLVAESRTQIPPFIDQDVADSVLDLLLKRGFIEVVPDSIQSVGLQSVSQANS